MDDLRAEILERKVRTGQLIAAIQRICFRGMNAITGIAADPAGTGRSIGVWNLGALWLAALTNGEQFDFEDLKSVPPIDTIGPLVKMSGGLVSAARASEPDTKALADETRLMMLRHVCTQSALQADPHAETFRTGVLLQCLTMEQKIAMNSPMDALFRDAFGCSTLEYWALLIALWCQSAPTSRSPNKGTFIAFNVHNFLPPESAHLQPSLQKIVKALSASPQDVKAAIATGRLADYDADGLVHAFFGERPFLAVGEGAYLYPPHPFLRPHAFGMAFFKALQLAREDAERGGSRRPWINEHGQRMGFLFESLLGSELSKLYPAGDLFDEYIYEMGHDSKSPDFIAFEGEECLLFQAKLKRWSPEAFFGSDLAGFESDARGALAEMVWKSVRFLARLQSARERRRIPGKFAGLSDRILSARRFLLVGVSPALPPVLRFLPFRESVQDAIAQRLLPVASREHEIMRDRVVGWHIVDWAEISAFRAVRRHGTSLFASIYRYLSELQSSPPVAGDSLFPSFRDWCVLNHASSAPEFAAPPTSHTRAFQSVWDHVHKVLFGRSDALPKE